MKVVLREGWSLVIASFAWTCERKGSKEGCLKRGLVSGQWLIYREMWKDRWQRKVVFKDGWSLIKVVFVKDSVDGQFLTKTWEGCGTAPTCLWVAYLRSMHLLANSTLLLTLVPCAFIQYTQKAVANVPFHALHLLSGTISLTLFETQNLLFVSNLP